MSDADLWAELQALAVPAPEASDGSPGSNPPKLTKHSFCRGDKKIYASKSAAKRHVQLLSRKKRSQGFSVRIYECVACSGWHVANKDKRGGYC